MPASPRPSGWHAGLRGSAMSMCRLWSERPDAKAVRVAALDLAAELVARTLEAIRDPVGLFAERQPRVAVAQRETDELELAPAGIGAPDREHAKVVAQQRICPVVIERVAEIVDDRMLLLKAYAVEDVRRVAGE
jgi:hypothetical protein